MLRGVGLLVLVAALRPIDASSGRTVYEANETIDDVLRAVLHSKFTPSTPVQTLEVAGPAVDDVLRRMENRRAAETI